MLVRDWSSDVCSSDLAAKKKPVDVLGVADAGIDPAQVGQGAAATEVVSFAARPPREAGTIVKDEGDGGAKAAEIGRAWCRGRGGRRGGAGCVEEGQH